jgi:cell filamentation protein
MSQDPYSDPVTGVLYNKLGLGTAAGLEAAEREITHAALILLDESPVSPSYDLPHLREIHRRIFITWQPAASRQGIFHRVNDNDTHLPAP